MLRSKHGEIRKKISCVLSADANEWKGNYVSHSCKVGISEIAFFPTIGNVSARRKTIYGVYNIKSCLAGQQGFHLNKLHKLVFNCHVQRIRRMIIGIRYIDSNDILVVLWPLLP